MLDTQVIMKSGLNSKLALNQFLPYLNHFPGPKKSIGTFDVQIEPVVPYKLTPEVDNKRLLNC